MLPTVVTPPSVEPVTLIEAKAHLNVLSNDDDTYIEALITVARTLAEEELGSSLITQTLKYYLDAFPLCKIALPQSPVQSITTLKYVDLDGALTTWDAANYTLDAADRSARVVPAYTKSWPSTRCQINAVELTYVAGYGDVAADIPAPIRHGILMLISDLYENRENTAINVNASEMPTAVRRLFAPYRVWRL